MNIRDAVAGDAYAICQVLRRSIRELCHVDHGNDEAILGRWLANKTFENVTSWIVDPGNAMLVASHGDIIAAVGCVTANGDIKLNYVLPEYRFCGLSHAVLNELETRAARQSNAECCVTSTKTAFRFYKARGYAENQTVPDFTHKLWKALPAC